jgi:hypothetical protein
VDPDNISATVKAFLSAGCKFFKQPAALLTSNHIFGLIGRSPYSACNLQAPWPFQRSVAYTRSRIEFGTGSCKRYALYFLYHSLRLSPDGHRYEALDLIQQILTWKTWVPILFRNRHWLFFLLARNINGTSEGESPLFLIHV